MYVVSRNTDILIEKKVLVGKVYVPYTEKKISEFFLFFIGTLPQEVENKKCY